MVSEEESVLSPVAPMPLTKSNLDLLNECDDFPYFETSPLLYAQHISHYYELRIAPSTSPLGYLLPSVAHILENAPGWELDHTERTLTLTEGTTEAERSTAVARTCEAMRATGHFKILEGWRNELYPIYGDVEGVEGEKKGSQVLCSVERAASALFGIVSYGCHMTAFTRGKRKREGEDGTEEEQDELKLWIPRRAATKQTYPHMLDNTVAGGIATGETPFESMIREAAEEASLPESLVRRKAKAVGTVTYFHIRDSRAGGETGLLQPECQYVYDLDLTGENVEDGGEVVPKPADDEVEGFMLMDVEDVKAAMGKGEFKPNCALVLLDFFVRHGLLSREDEPDYVEIVSRLHRRFAFPMG